MNDDAKIESLLKWRCGVASEEAPPAPRARALLEHARPWWEKAPEGWAEVIGRLRAMQLVPGHAMVAGGEAKPGHPVPVLDLRGGRDAETTARILYLSVRGDRVRMRILIPSVPEIPADDFEVAIVPDASEERIAAYALHTGEGEFRMDVQLPEAIAAEWAKLRVTDRMPFRFILGPGETIT